MYEAQQLVPRSASASAYTNSIPDQSKALIRGKGCCFRLFDSHNKRIDAVADEHARKRIEAQSTAIN